MNESDSDQGIETVNEAVPLKDQKECKKESPKDDVFLAVKNQVNEFNSFLSNNNIEKNAKNVCGAIKDMIRFCLMRPVVSFDEDLKVFSLKSVSTASSLMTSFKKQLLLFAAFDANQLEKKCWGISGINKDTVWITVQMKPETSAAITKKIKESVKLASSKGWKGSLVILTADETTSTLKG